MVLVGRWGRYVLRGAKGSTVFVPSAWSELAAGKVPRN